MNMIVIRKKESFNEINIKINKRTQKQEKVKEKGNENKKRILLY